MVQIILVAIGAGAAAALLFASVASGSPFSVLLFYLAPLPIMIAAVGWSHLAGLAAALIAAAALSAIFDTFFFLAFLAGVGLPAWWLSYLALLARPRAPLNGGVPILEWYPIGNLVAWAALIGAFIVVLAIPNFGTDADAFHAGLRRTFERILRVAPLPGGAPGEIAGVPDTNRLVEFLVAAIPPAAAVLSTLTNLISLWLAARIVQVSGRLKRPWPALSTLQLPRWLPAVLAAAVLGTFLPGLPAIVATLLVASLFMAYALLGLAVLHVITQPMKARGFVLGGVYAALFVFGWPVLLMTLLGLTEAALDIRARAIARRGPPPPASRT
jgi:hypothetical protein